MLKHVLNSDTDLSQLYQPREAVHLPASSCLQSCLRKGICLQWLNQFRWSPHQGSEMRKDFCIHGNVLSMIVTDAHTQNIVAGHGQEDWYECVQASP